MEPAVAPHARAAPLGIRSGQILLYRVFDIAQEVDLLAVERVLRAQAPLAAAGASGANDVARLRLDRQRDAIQFTNPPVTARLNDRDVVISGREYRADVTAKIYDFGAMTVLWTLPVASGTTLEALEDLSVELEQPEEKLALERWMAQDCELVMSATRGGLQKPALQAAHETLTIYAITAFDRDVRAEELQRHPALPGLLLGERDRFSEKLWEDLRAASFSYSERDLVVIGYDQALVYDPTAARDVANLLEFALAQVLELGYYDALLDRRLEDMHDRLARGRSRARYERLRRELLYQHVEFAEVLERVSSAVKVTEDFYYASIYRAALRVFRADELADATQRKLDLIYRTYSMLSDDVDTRTSHRLEWIIIALIVMELLLGLYDRLPR